MTISSDPYYKYLLPWLGKHFFYTEIVNSQGDCQHPPEHLYPRMPPTLEEANLLNEKMKAQGFRGLSVVAAYRPRGGASGSKHKVNAALDLQLLKPDYDRSAEFYELAVQHWCERGKEKAMGLGLYCAPGRRAGIRIHIDTMSRCRTWQHSNGSEVNPPAAFAIADAHGWTLPTLKRGRS